VVGAAEGWVQRKKIGAAAGVDTTGRGGCRGRRWVPREKVGATEGVGATGGVRDTREAGCHRR